jgi:hypothetical protein
MNAFRPQVETLSDRIVPAITEAIVTSANGSTLVIQGDNSSHTIALVDDGTTNAGNIQGTIDGQSIAAVTGGVAINTIQFTGGTAADTFLYQLTGNLTGVRNVAANLGKGNDVFLADFGGNVVAGSVANVHVVGGDGNKIVHTSFVGGIGGTLNQDIELNQGNSNVFTGISGPITGTVNSYEKIQGHSPFVETQIGADGTSTGTVNSYTYMDGQGTVVANFFNNTAGGSTATFNATLNAHNDPINVYVNAIGVPAGNLHLVNGHDVHTRVFNVM